MKTIKDICSSKELEEVIENYNYKVFFSKDDNCIVAVCEEFPSLSALGVSREEALSELKEVIREVFAWEGEG